MVIVVLIIVVTVLLMFFTFALEDDHDHSAEVTLVDLWSFEGRNTNFITRSGMLSSGAFAKVTRYVALFRTKDGRGLQLYHAGGIGPEMIGKTGTVVYQKNTIKRFELNEAENHQQEA